MTNAPFMLNVDCDMYANNSKIVLYAMCLLLGFKHEKEGAFVQYPQMYYDTLKDDPFGNQPVLPLKVRIITTTHAHYYMLQLFAESYFTYE